jgi:hypothetical protein
MKKLILLLLIASSITNLNAKYVKFSVDMSEQTINALGVHVAGDFQKIAGYTEDWNSSITTLTKEGNTSIYSIVVNIPANNKYEFKFINGDQFYDVEFVPIESRVGYEFNDNRWIYIDSLKSDTTIIPAVKFGGNAPEGYYLNRFIVNMSKEKVNSNGVHLFGTFSNWNALDNYMYSFDGLRYEIILYFKNEEIEFKFVNGDQTSNAESIFGSCKNANGNRTISVSSDNIMIPMCYEECSYCLSDVEVQIELKDDIIFPNPANESFSIKLENDKWYLISIFDNNANNLQTFKTFGNSNYLINSENFPAGYYFVRLNNLTDKSCSVSKLIIGR